ncbi:MAG: hypothetical protein U0935_11460 [Pirellulales bacterium]
MREIAKVIKGPVICGLARCNDADIDRAWERCSMPSGADPRASPPARFTANSSPHDPRRDRRAGRGGVQRAKLLLRRHRILARGCARTEHDFLCRVVEAAIAAGATTVNIPDTVGYATPRQMGTTIAMLKNRVPNIDQAVISVHCHNDLGPRSPTVRRVSRTEPARSSAP